MFTTIGSKITITDPSPELLAYCKNNLILDNPEYAKKQRMGFYLGNTPKKLVLYEINGNTVVLPFGCLRSILGLLDGAFEKQFAVPRKIDYGGEVPLYGYQEEAVTALLSSHYGILQSPAGSGKTQIGIALSAELGVKTLWLTHTKDLLNQSFERAAMYLDKSLLGTITEGKVNIGAGMTFATVQTMAQLDLAQYRDEWDCVIVDECHRAAGTPTAVTRFSKVLNSLCARHKYGLTATPHRADGMIKATYALLGEVVWTVPDEAVKSRIMRVQIRPIATGVKMSLEYVNSDGTTNYCKLINYLVGHEQRNQLILNDLRKSADHYCLILSERVDHLKYLKDQLPLTLQLQATVIDGKMTSKAGKALREQAIEDMRTGDKHYLFATYSLAKEGLDIPRLDRLFMVTPQKDYAVIVQSVGRVARTFPGKEQPKVYDYVDGIRSLQRAYKKRCTSYRKIDCEIMEV